MKQLPQSHLNLGQGISVLIDESGNYATFYIIEPKRYNALGGCITSENVLKISAANTGAGWLCHNDHFRNLMDAASIIKAIYGIR